MKKKSNQRWLWYAVYHATNKILAYVPGKRKDIVFKQLKELLVPFGISRYSVTILMIGGLTTVALRLISMKSARVIHKKLNGKF